MKDLAELITAIQKFADEFNGTISIKNASRRYFFANDLWLQIVGLKREEVIGKCDDEIVPEENAAHIRKTDGEALSRETSLEYTHTAMLQGKPVEYVALKWVIRYQGGEPFCICTIAALIHEKEYVFDAKDKIDELLRINLSRLGA